MLDPNWVFLSAVIGLFGSLRYAAATVAGRVTPNLVTWSLWAAAPLIAFLAQLDSGVGLPAVPTLSAGLGPLVVVVASLVAGRHRAIVGPFDLACGATAAVALGVWVGLGQAPVAVVIAVVADGVAALPTIVKAWRDPWSEQATFYALVGLGAVITLLTITSWEPAAWAFAGYVLVLSVLLCVLLVVRRRHLR
ncbi:hypothetical protein BHE97_09900 [Aeromicrobium sp. PE09-221]|uniref:hypothetical protein n=1 Tax=Aeromicrobium sp. PE09-221 TaxID=1898043 RepID=UPI000B3E63FB|nr:hypothetical protein [Aeromicrobium sp. PE09-221]OUZ09757.1 hypothetical protein BHE97_09900 [Aeromicrobium sp. PE09-221]